MSASNTHVGRGVGCSVGGVIAAAIAAHPHAVHARPGCPPAVALAGDASLVAVIEPVLRAGGIMEPRAGCPAAYVQIARGDHEVVLAIVDPDQRRFERRVADPATAAVLIESFVVTDEPEDPRGAEAVPPPAAAMAATEPPRVAVVHGAPPDAIGIDDELPADLVVPVPAAALHGALVLASETSIASDQSLWIGVRASACVRIGGLCIGSIARFQRDAAVSGDAEDEDATRWGADLMIAADLPIERDGVTVTPGLGAGVGWLHVRRDLMPRNVEANAGGLRADAHVSASIRIGELLRLRVGAAADLTPGAHTQPFHAARAMAPGEPGAFARLELGLEIVR